MTFLSSVRRFLLAAMLCFVPIALLTLCACGAKTEEPAEEPAGE